MKFNATEAIKRIKESLGFTDAPAAGDTAPVDALNDYQTGTGTTIKIDKLEAGGKAFTEDGVTPLLAGDYTLADGTLVKVADGGAITEVTLPSAATATPADAAMTALMAKFAAGTPEERITNLESMCKALMQYNFQWKINEATREAIEAQAIAAFQKLGAPEQFADKFSAMEAKHAKEVQRFNGVVASLIELIEKFAEQPADDPIQAPANAPAATETKRDRANRLLMAAKQAKA